MGIPGKLNLLLMAVGLVMLVMISAVYYTTEMRDIDPQLNQKVTVISDRLKISLPNSMFEYDMETLQATVMAEFPDDEVEAILVYDVDDELVFGMAREAGTPVEIDVFSRTENLIFHQEDLLVRDERYREVLGRVVVFLSRVNAESELVGKTLQGVMVLCLVFGVMVVLLGYAVNRSLVKPLEAIRQAMLKTSAFVNAEEGLKDWRETSLSHPLKELPAAFSELTEIEECFVAMVEEIQSHQEALSSREKHLRRIFNATSEAIIIRDAETGALRDVNDAMLAMYGYSKEEIYDLTIADLVYDRTPQTLEMIDHKIRRAFDEGPQLFELQARHKSGRPFWVEIALKHYQGSRGNRFLAVARDITVRKEQEDELNRYRESLEAQVQVRTRELRNAQQELVKKERLALLGQLNATVSHEIRNPLGTIANALSVIEDANKTGKAQLIEKSLALANRNVERCDRIISELLDFSRPRHLECSLSPLDEWIAREMEDYAFPEGLCLQSSYASDVTLSFDGERLRRALVNVLDNAVHAMQEEAASGKTLSVETRSAKGRVEIIVSDQGTGISDEDKTKIFEPLFSTKGFGVGLGMVIVKNILEQHGGGIDVADNPQGGTRVTLWLPVRSGQTV